MYDDAVKNKMFWNATPSFQEFQRRLQNPKYVQTVQANYRAHGRSGDAFDTLSGFRDYFCVSDEDRQEMTQGVGNMIADTKARLAGQQRYRKLKQHQDKQRGRYGRLDLGVKNPLTNDNVVREPLTGRYLTSDGAEYAQEYDAVRAQNHIDETGKRYTEAVKRGDIPSAFEVRDKDGNYALVEDLGVKPGVHVTEKGKQQQLAGLVNTRKSVEEQYNALYRKLEEDFKRSAPFSLNTHSQYGIDDNDMRLQAYLNSNAQYRRLKAQLHQLDNAIGVGKEAVKGRAEDRYVKNAKGMLGYAYRDLKTFGASALRGLWNAVSDVSTWDLGLQDLQDNMTLYTTVKKARQKGYKNLNSEERQMLDVAAKTGAYTAENQQYLGRGYKAGNVTGESLPFMVEMALNPASGLGEAAMSKYMRNAIAKYGKEAVRKEAWKYVTKKCGYRIAGDVLGAALMTGTTGSARTLADTYDRLTGDIKSTYDSNGNIVYDGTENEEKGILKAYLKAFGATAIENHSEFVGEYFNPLLKGVGTLTMKGWKKVNAKSANAFLDNLKDMGSTSTAKWLGNLFDKTQWHGTIGEYAEEVVGNIENALLVGDSTLDTKEGTGVFNLDQNIDTFLGVSLMGGFFSTLKTGAYVRDKVKGERKILMQQSLDLDNSIRYALGADPKLSDKWKEWRVALAQGTDEEKKQALKEISENTNGNIKKAMYDYSANAQKLAGMDKATQGAIEDGTITPEQAQRDADIEQAHEEGLAAEGTARHDIQQEHQLRENSLARMLGISAEQLDRMEDGDIESMTGQNDALDTAIYDYQTSRERYQGVIDRATDEVEQAGIDAAHQIDLYTDHSTGQIRPCVIKGNNGKEDYQGYIVNGNIATHPDGAIDVSGSDKMILYFDPETGKIEHGDASTFASLGESADATVARQQAIDEAKQQAAQAQSRDIDGGVGEDGNVSEAMPTFPQSSDQEERNAADFDIGQVVNAETGEVIPVSFEGLAEGENAYLTGGRPDGKAKDRLKVTIVDAEGNVTNRVMKRGNVQMDGRMSAEDFRNAYEEAVSSRMAPEADINGQENNVDEEGVVAGGAAPSADKAATSEEEGAASEPAVRDKNGNPIYDKMPISATIADLYDGALDDAEIDGFVSAQIAEAEKAVEKMEKKKPKVGTDKAKYLADKKAWEEGLQEAQRKVQYWHDVKAEVEKITTPEDARGYEEELNGDAAQAAYRNGSDAASYGVREVTAEFMQSGDVKITPESYRKETGFGAAEQRAMVGKISKGGKSIDKLAEDLEVFDRENYNGMYFGGDSSVAKDAILDYLSSPDSRKGVKKMQSEAEREYVEAYEAERDRYYQEKYHMSYEEYLVYSSQEMPELLRKYSNFDEQLFLERYADEIEAALQKREEQLKQEENGKEGNVSAGEESGHGRSNQVQSGERTDDTGRGEVGKDSAGEVGPRHEGVVESEAASKETITPEQQSLLSRRNSSQYTAERESSDHKATNNTDTKQENEEKSAKALSNKQSSGQAKMSHKEKTGEKEAMSPTPAMIDRMIEEQRVDDVSELLISSELKKAAEGIAGAFGMKVVYLKKVFIRSNDPAVEDFEGNGFVRNGVIYLSLKEANIAQFTFGHELLHQLKQIDADSYMRIRQKVIDVMGRKAFEMEVKARQMTYANVPGYTLFEDYAEEVIADTLGDIITHTDMLPNIARSLKENPSLLDRLLNVVDNVRQYFRGKIGDALGDLVNDIRNTYEMTARQGAELGLSTPLKITEHTKFSLKDNQGNPLNQDGTLKLEKIKSVDELTDEDFLHPTRNVELPSLPKKIADAIGTEGKPVVIKKNIFERNYMRHKDVTPELSKIIFKSALYNPDLYGQNQKKTRPYNWVLINTKDEKGNNRTVLLEVNPNKDNVEIVHWHFIDERGLKKIRKQVDREDGQLLILPSDKEEVGALSDPTVNLSAANIDNSSETAKESDGKDRQFYASLGVSRQFGDGERDGEREQQTANERLKGEGYQYMARDKFSLRLAEAKNNTDKNPSQAQKESGNYRKGHIRFGGYNYTIENPQGSYRSGVDENGKKWKQKMNNTYGYIIGTKGKDGDHLDMFINDKADLDSWNGNVYVVDQVFPDGSFDEHKVMYGFDSEEEARKAYLSNYEQGWQGLGNITGVSKEDFDRWLEKSGRKTKAFSEYSSVKKETEGNKPSEASLSLSTPLTDEEVVAITDVMKANATVAPTVEINDANWKESVDTPIGAVKMGENQKAKLFAKGREQQYGMLLETLSNPDVVLEEKDKEQNMFHERPSSYLFVKTFQKEDGSKYVHFESVTVSQEGMEVSISSHIIRENQLKNKLKSDRLLYKATALDAPANTSAEQPIVGGSLSSDGKDTEKVSSGQEDGEKNVLSDLEREFQKALEHEEDVEQKWEDKIQDYVAEHYPTQATVSAATTSAKGVQEREAMKSDHVLRAMREKADAEYKEARDATFAAQKKMETAKESEGKDRQFYASLGVSRQLGEDAAEGEPRWASLGLSEQQLAERQEVNGGTTLFSLKKDRTLAGVHNITEEKLLKAIKQGGLANPSVAVIDSSKQNHDDYGDISLILPSDKVAKRTGKNAGTWQGDAWTPTYPQVERQMSNKGAEKASNDVGSVPGYMYSEVRRGLDRWLDGGEENSAMAYMFLHEKGVAPEPKKIQPKFSDEAYNELKSITAGNFNIYGIGKADARKVLDMYIDAKFDGDKDLYEEKTKAWLERNKSIVDAGANGGMRYAIAKENIELYDEYGFNYKGVQTFVRDVEYDHRKTGVDMNATLNEVEDYIKTNNLTDEFNTWMEGKEKEYGIKEVIFDGFTPSGNRRYVPNTLENVSKIMKKQGRNGSTGISVSFQNFAARLMPSYGTLKDIRSKKGLLTSDRENLDKFREKWSNVFFELGVKCQPDATGTFDDYGLARLSEAAMTSDPQAYLKKEYNVDFSDEDTKRLKEMVKAIKEESPAMYFETKFERPVGFDEFSSAVVPTTASNEVKQALQNAGVQIYEYDKEKEGDRSRAFNEALEGDDNIRFSLDKDKGTVASPSKPSKAEAVLRDAVIDRLRENGMEVITDVAEGQKVLDEANGRVGYVRSQVMFSSLTKAASAIRGWLATGKRGKSFTIELPETTRRMIRKVMGRDFDSHNITADGIRHGLKNHGAKGKKLTERSILIRNEDAELIPYIMTAPDYVRKGSTSNGRESIRFYKTLENGYVVVVEKEFDNSDKDLETINIWGELSDVINAQRTLNRTSETPTISRSDAAKIRKDAEIAIAKDQKLREQRVYHGSGADFEAFDHSHMGEGQGSQVFGWGTYVTSSKAIGESYAQDSAMGDSPRMEMEYTGDVLTENEVDLLKYAFDGGMRSYHETEEFLEKIANSDKPGAKRSANALSLLRKTKPDDWTHPLIGKRQLYTVEIPEDNGSNYLDWENPLNDAQKEILKEGLMAAGVSVEYFKGLGFTLDSSFKYVYSASLPMMLRGVHVGEADNVKEKASRFLSGLGFTGIKYPAGTIHGGAEKGDMNYVIFNEKDAKITDHVRFFRTANGEAYGFTVGGKIYVDPRIATSETPVHEYAHLWASALRNGNKEEWQNVVGLMKDSKVWDEVKKRYPELKTDDEIADEVIATYSGRRGAERLREEQRKIAEGNGGVFEKAEAISALEHVKRALKMFWKGVADFLHIHYKSAEEVADRVMKDLLEGVDPRKMGDGVDRQRYASLGVSRSLGEEAGEGEPRWASLGLSEQQLDGDDTIRFSLRQEPAPKVTKKGYAVFIYKKLKNGGYKLVPKMLSNDPGAPAQTWLNADTGYMKRDENGEPLQNTNGRASVSVNGSQAGGNKSNKLAWRPGKHLAMYPNASQFKSPDGTIPKDVIFFEVEYAADPDLHKQYQRNAWELGMNDNGQYRNNQGGLPYIPKDSYYLYRTNSISEGATPMIITGAYKINRALTDAEAKELNQNAGGMWCPRKGGDLTEEKLKDMGLDDKGLKKMTESFDMDTIKESHDESDEARLLPGYKSREINWEDKDLIHSIEENGQDINDYRDGYVAPEHSEEPTIRFSLDKDKGTVASPSKPSKAEAVLRDAVIDRLRENGMEVITDVAEGQKVLDEANGKGKLQMGDAPETFAERQKLAVENRGVVMPGLNETYVEVVKDIPRHGYTGTIAEATKQAIQKAKEKYVPEGKVKVLHYDNNGAEFDYVISGNAIEICLSPKHQAKSGNKGVHLALAEHLDEVINKSVEVEEHPDYIKGKDGKRGEYINPNAIMHRFYGVAIIDGVPCRIMTLMREDARSEESNGIHSYEVQKIEMLDNELPSISNGVGTQINELSAYPLAKLLKGVEKAYDKGKYLLEESEKRSAGLREQRMGGADGLRFFRTANGEAYGFTVGGKIYVDPRIATSETPVHEYAHLWASALRNGNKEEWQNVVGLMKDSKVWDEVKKRYPELKTDDEIADEVIATYSGRRGAERLREEQRKIAEGNGGVFEKAEAISALEHVKRALKMFWKGVADFLHIHYKSAEEVADRVMKDLLEGVDPRSMMDGGRSLRPDTRINVVEVNSEHGFKNYAEAKTWAKEHIARTYSSEETGGKGDIRISNAAINKYLSQSAVDKSDSKDVHLSVLKVLPEVIRESVDAEQHADYKKGEDGVRSAKNGINPNVTIHRLYGAVRMDGKVYRVKVTLKEDKTSKEPKVPHSYEATKIELFAGTLGNSDNSLSPNTNNSITAAKLLNGVEKSYGGGKFFEDYNRIRKQFIGEKGAVKPRWASSSLSEPLGEEAGEGEPRWASLGLSEPRGKEAAEEAGEGEPRWASWSLSEQQLDGDDTVRFSLNYDKWDREMASWLKRNRLPKNAQRPVVPQREVGESDLHFAGRLAKYNQDKALWNTAPKYEGHLSSGMTARGEFNYELQRGSVLTRIAVQDSMLAIRKAQEAIARHSGLLKVGTFEDAYMAENNSHGKAKNEFEQYDQEYLAPLRKWFNVMMKRLDGSYNNVTNYMIAKHGLERNAHMAFMAALEAEAKKAIDNTQPDAKRLRAQMVHDAYKQYKADSRRLINDADYQSGKYDYAQWRRTDDAIRKSYCSNYESFRYNKGGVVRDYAGLSSLFQNETDFEEKAAELCADIESKNGHETGELWDAVRQATRQILKNSHDAGMMSDETYDYVRGMYEHYIPLRGWNDSAADEVWDYAGGGRGVFNAALKEAHGRQSLADDPVAYIMNMAESGFLVNNKNWVKQHFLMMAMNHPSDLLTVSKAWYVKTKDQFGNEVWIPASPNIPADETDPAVIEAALDAFQTKMEQMEQSGDATQQRGSLNIEYPQTKSEEREHEVRVMKDGEEYVIYVNGDPQLAQALNNTRAMRVREHEGLFEKACAWLGRKMAAVYTSLSPLFVPSNWARDTTMTLASTAIREDARYNWLLRTKFMRPDVQMRMFGLVKEYQNGKLREKVKSRTATKMEENFWNFMINGGETGFVSTMDVDAFREKIQRDLKDMDRTRLNPVKVGHIIADSVEYINRVIEDSNRFAIYQTSIEYGRGIEEAVQDAKNVTLNFNRKGTGEMGMSAIRQLYLFINPAIQSLQTLGALAKEHKAKFTAVTSAWMASGMLVPLFNELMFNLASAVAGGGGDDDDEFNPKDEYWKFSSFDRRNNCILWIPFTHNFIKIPLAQEFRGFYGIGDMVASAMWGGENAKESWSNYAADLMGQIIDLSPLDPVSYDGNVLVSLMPNAIRPLVEIAQNVTFTGKPIYRESDFNKYDPSFKKAYAGTPDFLLRYSKWMNSIGNKYPEAQQGPVEQTAVGRYANNPAVIDHLLKSYLGGMYTLGSQIAGAITKASDEETRKDFKTADIPFFSKFVANPNDRPQSKNKGDAYWQDFEKYQRSSHTLGVIRQDARKTGNFSVLEDFYKSEEYKEMKEYEPKAKQRKEEQKYEKWKEEGNADLYQPHQQTGEDVYKRHSTPADDFEDTKASILYQKIKPAKDIFDLADINTPSGMDTFNKYYDLAGKVEEAHSVKKEMNAIVKSFVNDEHKATFDPEKMKEYRVLRKQYLQLVEDGNRMFEKIKAQRN